MNSTPPNPKVEEAFNAQLAEETLKRTARLQDTSIDLAVRLKEAREFMAWSASHVREAWLQWMETANAACHDMTAVRMTFERESKSIVATGKDVAQFFNSEQYMMAHVKFRDLVSTLERFQKLKADGTLDAFADFILKVSCKE